MEKINKILNKKNTKYVVVFFAILIIQLVLGLLLQKNDYVINICSLLLFFGVFLYIKYLRKNKKELEEKKIGKHYSAFRKHIKLFSFLIIILLYIPELLAFAPTILNYDGPSELVEEFNEQQPLIYTLFLRMFFYGGLHLINSASLGMMFFSITQIILMAFFFSIAIEFIDNTLENKYITIFALFFYALFPYNKIFPLMTTKDCLFAGICLLYIVQTFKILNYKKEENDLKKYMYYVIIIVIMLLLRKNCKYALIATIPFIIFLTKENKKKAIIIYTVIGIVLYLIINNVLVDIINPKRDKVNEKLSIISQVIARISREKYEELTEEEKNRITHYYGNIDKLSGEYNEIIADNTKGKLNDEKVNENPAEFYDFAIKTLLKYPNVSIKAYLLNMKGYWYLFDDSICTIHKDDEKGRAGDFGILEIYTLNKTNEQKLMVEEYNLIPSIKKIYKDLFCLNYYRKIPGIYTIFQPAFYLYLLIGYILYCIYKKDKVPLIIGLFLIMYYLTCFLGPCAIVRYIYNVIVATPIFVGYLLKREKNEASYEKNRK